MFLRNRWYVAAWAEEVGRKPLGRFILNEPIVFFRRQDGTAVALEDRCAHRRLPLSMGWLVEDTIQCQYHGLIYDCDGKCISVPAQPNIPPKARVKAYRLIERHGCLWIWMGDAALADDRSIPDIHWADDPDWGVMRGQYNVKCNYQYLHDNLLDLSHLAFVHAKFTGNQAVAGCTDVETRRDGDTVWVERWMIDVPAPKTYSDVYDFGGNVDRWQIVEFIPPGVFRLQSGCAITGTGARNGDRSQGIELRNNHGITPETDRTTHFFFSIATNFAAHDKVKQSIYFPQARAVIEEDVVLLDAQQRMIDVDPDAPTVDIRLDAGPRLARLLIDELLAKA